MKIVRVAVGIIINKKNQILIAKRASHQHQGNKWEFPGGKVESNETSQQALKRELKEELGVEIQNSTHLIDINHKYKNKLIQLEVYEVKNWLGDAVGREGQPLQWVEQSELSNYEFPDANAEILSILGVQ